MNSNSKISENIRSISISVGTIIPEQLYKGWVIHVLWTWFLVPLGIQAVGIFQAIGILCLINLVIPVKLHLPENMSELSAFGYVIFQYSVVLGFCYIIHLAAIAHP
jgi:hypothetical protein